MGLNPGNGILPASSTKTLASTAAASLEGQVEATASSSTSAALSAAASPSSPAGAPVAGAEAATTAATTANLPKKTQISLEHRDRSVSRKRKNGDEAAAIDAKRHRQMSTGAGKVESVFLIGINANITKNGKIFKKEFSKALPNIKIDKINITGSGTVILSPATPEDFNRLMKVEWAHFSTLGSNISASLPRTKKVEHKVVVTGVEPDLDDDTLKTELEERNSFKVTGLTRLVNKETQARTWKVIVCLENGEAQKDALWNGVYLGWTVHRCMEAFDSQQQGTADTIRQCFKCQKWDPDHTSTQCKGTRACLWCSADHFHKECPHFKGKDRANAKCANCNEAHPAWSKSCAAFTTATKNSPKVTASRVVSSASISRKGVEEELKTAMAKLWDHMANMVSFVVSKAILDLEAELKKPKVNRGELVLKTTANTVRAIKECGPLLPNGTPEVSGVQQNVWKMIFPQNAFPHPTQASSTPQNVTVDAS